jgi:hypothetical protein
VSGPRVGIIGARRHRQGLGPHVARHLRDAGAEVVCFLATRAQTLEEARRDLDATLGIRARGYLDLEEMLQSERPDALAILSPAETHRRYLDAALTAGLHVLCEKPFVWGEGDVVQAARRIVSGFESRGLVLRESCQWPYTLPAFFALHPQTQRVTPKQFVMRLSPISAGAPMIPDAVPHALSLLQAIAPVADIRMEKLRFSTRRPDAPELSIGFQYRADGHAIETEIHLIQSEAAPKEAGYAINGCSIRRLVRASDYAIFFASGARVVDVPDPLALLVRDFVGDLRCGPGADGASRTRPIVQRMRLLADIAAAFGGGTTGEPRHP